MPVGWVKSRLRGSASVLRCALVKLFTNHSRVGYRYVCCCRYPCMMRALATLLLLPVLHALHLPAARLVETPACVLDVSGSRASMDEGASASYTLSLSREAGLSARRITAADTQAHSQDADVLLQFSVLGRRESVNPPAGYQPVGTSLLLSDDLVNVYEFRLAPGERCAYHHHLLPYCFVNLSSSLTQALARDGRHVGEPSFQNEGHCVWVAPDQLGAHGVLNVGESEFLQFIIECKFEL